MSQEKQEFDYEAFVEEARAEAPRFVRSERVGDVVTITLTDPASMNALSPSLMVGLNDALRAALDARGVRAVVLTGEGAFCAGGDLRMMRDVAHPMLREASVGAPGIWQWIRHQFGGVVRQLHQSDKAVVSAVVGPAAGVGMAFVLASDQVFAAHDASFLLAFSRLGLVPEVGTSWRLVRQLGHAKTLELFLRRTPLDGAEMVALGLANQALPAQDVLPAAQAWAAHVAKLPPHLFPMTKTLLRQAASMSFEQALAMEEFAEPLCFTTGAHQQAVNHLLQHGFGGR